MIHSVENQQQKSIKSTVNNSIKTTFNNAVKQFRNSGISFNPGDFILARMKGYQPWAARIISFSKDARRINIYFYGSHNYGTVSAKECIPFKFGYETIRLIKLKNLKHFTTGIQEIEIEHGVPPELSSLRDIGMIS